MILILALLVTLVSVLLAGHMARKRHRSVTAWAWVAVFVGPLAPLALHLLGKRRTDTANSRV